MTSFIAPRGQFIWLTGIISHHTHTRTQCEQKHVSAAAVTQFIAIYLALLVCFGQSIDFWIVSFVCSQLHFIKCVSSVTFPSVLKATVQNPNVNKSRALSVREEVADPDTDSFKMKVVISYAYFQFVMCFNYNYHQYCCCNVLFSCKTQLLFCITFSIFWHLLSRGVNTNEFRFKFSWFLLPNFQEHEAVRFCHPKFLLDVWKCP